MFVKINYCQELRCIMVREGNSIPDFRTTVFVVPSIERRRQSFPGYLKNIAAIFGSGNETRMSRAKNVRCEAVTVIRCGQKIRHSFVRKRGGEVLRCSYRFKFDREQLRQHRVR